MPVPDNTIMQAMFVRYDEDEVLRLMDDPNEIKALELTGQNFASVAHRARMQRVVKKLYEQEKFQPPLDQYTLMNKMHRVLFDIDVLDRGF